MNTLTYVFRKLAAALVLSLGFLLPQAHAAAEVYTLNGVAEDGPLAGGLYSGQFAFDRALLSGIGDESLVLDWVKLDVFGQQFDANAMAAAPTASFFDGSLLGIDMVYDGGLSGFAFVSGFFSLDDAYFAYQSPLGAGFGSVAIAPVPEPSQVLMLLAGLGLVGGMVRRRAS